MNGYRPRKKEVRERAARTTAEDKLAALKQSGQLDPSQSSAALSLANLKLTDATDFDGGIRMLKRGLRDAAIADNVVSQLQTQALMDHDANTRHNDAVMNNNPPQIADSLGVQLATVAPQFQK